MNGAAEYWKARAERAQIQVREAAALTLAYLGSNGGTRLDDAIPQETWDSLTERGLVRHGRDHTGEGYAITTDEGIEYLLALASGSTTGGDEMVEGEELKAALDRADEALENLPDLSEAFTSAVDAARSAINAARAIAIEKGDGEPVDGG